MPLAPVLWLMAQALAQETPPPNPLLSIADTARAAPPEFCADILLRLATPKRADNNWTTYPAALAAFPFLTPSR